VSQRQADSNQRPTGQQPSCRTTPISAAGPYQIAFALRRAAKIVRGLNKIVRGLKLALTEDERFAVGGDVVTQLKQHGDPWRLSEEAQPKNEPTT
jgi:hypothetical protein